MSMPPTYNLLERFRSNVFVETGSYRGDAIKLALDAGFDKIISIDVDPAQIEFCKSRFDLHYEDNPLCKKITLVQGDSVNVLADAIKDIAYDQRVTFWLDAHWQMLEGTERGINPFPVLKELEIISQWHKNRVQAAADKHAAEIIPLRKHPDSDRPTLGSMAARHTPPPVVHMPTILIDDMLIFQPAITGFSNTSIRRKLFEINPEYQLQYIPNPVINGILAAYVK